MSAVTQIRVGDPKPSSSAAIARDAGELLAAVDDRTRTLLSRDSRARRGWLVRRGLVIADLVGLISAFSLTMLLTQGGGPDGPVGLGAEFLFFVISMPLWIVVAKLHGLYDRDEERASHSTADDVVGVFHLVTIGVWLLVAGSLVTHWAEPDVPRLMVFWLAASLVVPLARGAAREVCHRSAAFQQNTLIVGAGEVGQLLARKFLNHPEYGINVVGFVDRWPKIRREDLPEHLTILGPPEKLTEIVHCLGVERVVISFSSVPTTETLELVRTLRELNVQIDLVPRLFEVVGPNVALHTVEGLPLLGLPPARLTRSSRVLKRSLDIAGASLGLLVTAPLFAIIAVAIRRESDGPVFFRQTRLGCGMKQFTALKFRTMKVDTDQSVHERYIGATMSAEAVLGGNGLYKLDRGDAVTRVGRVLRKTSLDELPQLINVLKGEMSLVGPRPCIPYETEHFKPHQFERFLVPQGLTGLWQVTARASSTFGEALDMDVAYVRGWSLGLDLRLMLRTPFQMLRQQRSTA
jgi:exopolysaccharide biosynthesis polyprenyl glycosylphosphotransferase